jgi:ankyrin repeat protein
MRLLTVLVALLLGSGPSEAPVADAAQRGDVEAVRQLLRSGADVNAAQGDGMSALHWAASRDREDILEVLLYAGANTEASTRLGGYTALHLAARAGHGGAIGRLVDGGADVESVTTTGVTAMHFAAQSGDVGALEALTSRGATVDARTRADDQTPLMWATAANRLDAMRSLLLAGADPALTSSVVDYVARAAADRPERQLRSQLASVRRNAERAQEGGEAGAAPRPGPRAPAGPPAVEKPTEEAPAGQGTPTAGTPSEEGRAAEEAPPAEETPLDDEPTGEAPPTEEPSPAEEVPVAEAPQPAAEEAPGQQGATATEARKPEEEEERPLGYDDLVGKEGGFTALHFASRDGFMAAAELLLDAGADIDQPTAGDGTTPLLMATINGNFDLAMRLLERGGDPNAVAEDGAAPLFTVLNRRWGPKAAYPQPSAFQQQETDYLELLAALVDAGADVNHRTGRHIWYTSFNFDMLGVDFAGATAFWRAAYATDVEAMRLLVAAGADPAIPTRKVPARRFGRGGDQEDKSGLPPVPTGGPGVHPIHAASGVGYGEGFAANSHSHAPDSWLAAVRYLVEEHGADVNARDLNGYAPLHHAAARGDNELIEYLVAHGADVMVVSRRGETTVDMANGPRQRVQPFPETIALLESLGALNNHNCQSCE